MPVVYSGGHDHLKLRPLASRPGLKHVGRIRGLDHRSTNISLMQQHDLKNTSLASLPPKLKTSATERAGSNAINCHLATLAHSLLLL
jgi:hypothetical protein